MVDLSDNINMHPQFSNQTQIRLNNKINEKKDYSIAEIWEREEVSKGHSKYIAAFDYFDKASIVLSATSGGVSIASFVTAIGATEGIASASFSFAFSNATGIKNKTFKNNM